MKTNQLMIEMMMLALIFSQLWPLGCSIIRASTSSALIDTFENTQWRKVSVAALSALIHRRPLMVGPPHG